MYELLKKLSFGFVLVFSFLTVSLNSSARTEKSAESIKIITYNIWNGYDLGKMKGGEKNWLVG